MSFTLEILEKPDEEVDINIPDRFRLIEILVDMNGNELSIFKIVGETGDFQNLYFYPRWDTGDISVKNGKWAVGTLHTIRKPVPAHSPPESLSDFYPIASCCVSPVGLKI